MDVYYFEGSAVNVHVEIWQFDGGQYVSTPLKDRICPIFAKMGSELWWKNVWGCTSVSKTRPTSDGTDVVEVSNCLRLTQETVMHYKFDCCGYFHLVCSTFFFVLVLQNEIMTLRNWNQKFMSILHILNSVQTVQLTGMQAERLTQACFFFLPAWKWKPNSTVMIQKSRQLNLKNNTQDHIIIFFSSDHSLTGKSKWVNMQQKV